MKARFVFDKYDPNNIKSYQQNHFIFYWTIVSVNLIIIGSLVTETQNFGKYMRLILYNIDLFWKVWPLSKKVLQQNSFIFRLYVWIPNFIGIDSLGEKLRIYDIFLPIFKAPSYVRVLFSSDAIFLINEYFKTNISAEFDSLIRNINVSTIIPRLINRIAKTGYPTG